MGKQSKRRQNKNARYNSATVTFSNKPIHHTRNPTKAGSKNKNYYSILRENEKISDINTVPRSDFNDSFIDIRQQDYTNSSFGRRKDDYSHVNKVINTFFDIKNESDDKIHTVGSDFDPYHHLGPYDDSFDPYNDPFDTNKPEDMTFIQSWNLCYPKTQITLESKSAVIPSLDLAIPFWCLRYGLSDIEDIAEAYHHDQTSIRVVKNSANTNDKSNIQEYKQRIDLEKSQKESNFRYINRKSKRRTKNRHHDTTWNFRHLSRKKLEGRKRKISNSSITGNRRTTSIINKKIVQLKIFSDCACVHPVSKQQ